jgi:hypothetical protein
MSNHIHLIWQPLFGFTPSDVQASFMKYTAQQLKRLLEENDKDILLPPWVFLDLFASAHQ